MYRMGRITDRIVCSAFGQPMQYAVEWMEDFVADLASRVSKLDAGDLLVKGQDLTQDLTTAISWLKEEQRRSGWDDKIDAILRELQALQAELSEVNNLTDSVAKRVKKQLEMIWTKGRYLEKNLKDIQAGK